MGRYELFMWLILILGGYLLGSVLFARVIPLTFFGTDICELSDDGNPGVFNAFSACGWKIGALCLVLELGKGFLPVFAVVKRLDPQSILISLVMASAVLGHAFPVFNRFRGGKCIAVIFGELIALLWVTPVCFILVVLYVLFSLILRLKPNRRCSIITFSLFLPLSMALEIHMHQYAIALGCGLVSAIAIYKHVTDHSEAERKPAVK